jgi:hypothetical protein
MRQNALCSPENEHACFMTQRQRHASRQCFYLTPLLQCENRLSSWALTSLSASAVHNRCIVISVHACRPYRLPFLPYMFSPFRTLSAKFPSTLYRECRRAAYCLQMRFEFNSFSIDFSHQAGVHISPGEQTFANFKSPPEN